MLADDRPMGINKPTHAKLKIHGAVDFEQERQKWIVLLEDYDNFGKDGFMHPFFGKMTHKDIGRFAFKHIDHHLRQFHV